MFYSESLRNVVVILFKCKLLNIKQISVFLQNAGMGALRFELMYRRGSHWKIFTPNIRNAEGWSKLPLCGPFTDMVLLHQPILHDQGKFSCNNILKYPNHQVLLPILLLHWYVSCTLPNYWKLPFHS